MGNFKFSQIEYKPVDFEECKKVINECRENIENAKNVNELISAYKKSDDYFANFDCMCTIAFIRNTLDLTDEYYEKQKEIINHESPKISGDMVELSKAITTSPFRKELEEIIGKQFFVLSDLSQKSFTEKNVPLRQEEARLCSAYEKIIGTAKIPYEGKDYNIYGIQKFFEHEDRSLRKTAYDAYTKFFIDNEDAFEEIWSKLIEIRNQMGKNLGFENYIPLGYMEQKRADYGKEQVEKFRKQVLEEIVPFCSELYKAQAKRLGLDKVMVYDEDKKFNSKNAEPLGDDEFMVAKAKEMYHNMSEVTGEFIDFMIEHELMDLKNKQNKASTGYMTTLLKYKAPFVFSCFNGTIGDMLVLTHELGHALAGYMAMRDQEFSDNLNIATDIAEIHSMSMEYFAYPYADKFFGEDAEKFKFMHSQDALTFIPFGVAVDEFQHICYENQDLTPKERTLAWSNLEKKYMPWRDYGENEFMQRGGHWYHKVHIFLYPFYYINYTLTSIGALEFAKKMNEDSKTAWEDYFNLCKIGSKLGYLDTLKLANLKIPFEDGSVKNAVSYAKELLTKNMQKDWN